MVLVKIMGGADNITTILSASVSIEYGLFVYIICGIALIVLAAKKKDVKAEVEELNFNDSTNEEPKKQESPIYENDVNDDDVVEPKHVQYKPKFNTFNSTLLLLMKLAMKTIQMKNWTIEQVNNDEGIITFTMEENLDSDNKAVSSLSFTEVSEFTYLVIGAGKKNQGEQLVSDNDIVKAQMNAQEVIESMQELAAKIE